MNAASLYLTWYRVAFAVVLMLLALRSTRRLIARSAELGLIPSAPEAVLNVVQDPYVVVVFGMLFWVVWVGLTLSTSTDPVVLLRHGSRTRWTLQRYADAAREAALLLTILLGTALASSTGLSWTSSWTRAAALDFLGQLLPLWVSSGVPPLLAILLQLLLTFWGFLTVFAAVTAATLLPTRHRELVLVIACTIGFAAPLLLFKLPTGGGQVLVTLIAARPPGWPATPILALCLLIGSMLALTHLLESRPLVPPPNGLPALVYAVLIGSLMALVALTSSAPNLGELLREIFYGSSVESFTLPRYLLHTLAFLGPAYLALLALGSGSLPRMPLIAVRHGRIWPWLRAFLARQLLVAALVVAAMLALAVMLALGNGIPLGVDDPQLLWQQFVLNGVLQIYVATTVAVLVVLLVGAETAGLAALLVLAALGVPALTHGFAPFGANLLGLLDSHGYTAWRGTAVLSTSALALTLLGYAVTALRAPQRLITGRNHARY